MKEKITNIEIACVMFLCLFSCLLGIAPYTLVRISGIDSYISVIIGSVMGICLVLLFIYLFNFEDDKNIFDKNLFVFGKVMGRFVNFLMVLFLIVISTTLLFNTGNFVISQYLTETPLVLVILIFGMTIFYTASKGIVSICKISFIYVIIIVCLFVMAIIGLLPEMEMDNLKPVLEFGMKRPLIGGVVYMLLFCSPIFGILIIPKKKVLNSDKSKWFFIGSYLFVSIIIFMVAIVASSCLGKYLLMMYQYPAYITLKKISIFGFIDRIENFLSIQWIFSSFVTIALLFVCIRDSVVSFKMKNVWRRGIGFVIIALLILLSSFVFRSNTIFNSYLIYIYPYILLGFVFLMFVIFFGVFFKKRYKK